MSIAISETHHDLESVARSLLHKVGARSQARELLDATDEARPVFWSEIADLGWPGLHLSEEFGGSGFGLPELVVVLQELGRALAPGPFLPTVLASTVIDSVGSDATRSALLPGLADGSTTAALGLDGSQTLAGVLVSGDAGAVLGAGLADVLVLACGDAVCSPRATCCGCSTCARPSGRLPEVSPGPRATSPSWSAPSTCSAPPTWA